MCSFHFCSFLQEGAVERLLLVLTHGDAGEQAHAARLLAILAQADPTHGTMQAADVVAAVIRVLVKMEFAARSAAQRDGAHTGRRFGCRESAVVEHVCCILAVLSQNPNTHFQMVGSGAVPVLVPLLLVTSGDGRSTNMYSLHNNCYITLRNISIRAAFWPHSLSLLSWAMFVRQWHARLSFDFPLCYDVPFPYCRQNPHSTTS